MDNHDGLKEALQNGQVDVAVVLPAYNESATIRDCIVEFHEVLPSARIFVVDNNSSDDTSQIAQDTMTELGVPGGVLSEQRQGKGNAVRRAFLELDADIFVMCDADKTYPAQSVMSLVTPVFDGRADMVVGDRHSSGGYASENKRAFHGFGNSLVTWLVNSLFKANLRDIMSGYRAFSGEFVKHYPILVEGFEIETDLTLHALDKRFRILEVEIDYSDRPEGSESKLNTFSDGFRVLFAIMQILRHYNPLRFFGVLSLIFCLLGLLAGVPVIDDWIRERHVYHIPLAILATGLEIIAVLLLTVGLVLDSIVHHDKRLFELQRLRKE